MQTSEKKGRLLQAKVSLLQTQVGEAESKYAELDTEFQGLRNQEITIRTL